MASLYNICDKLGSGTDIISSVCVSFKGAGYKYDYGFILLVIGWVVAVLSMLLLFIKI